MYDFSALSPEQMTELGDRLRALGGSAASMEEAAHRMVRALYEGIKDPVSGRPACALVRFYKTHAFQDLPFDLKEFARAAHGAGAPDSLTRCLTLLATVGDEPAWNDRRSSVNHQAIPLPSRRVVARLPMIAQLVKQLGLEVTSVVQPDPALIVDLEQKTFNVFYVHQALDSPFIPAQQQFVIPYKIKSVVGFGGILLSGDLFAVILFSRIAISAHTAELFKHLAANVKLAVLPFVAGRVFEEALQTPVRR